MIRSPHLSNHGQKAGCTNTTTKRKAHWARFKPSLHKGQFKLHEDSLSWPESLVGRPHSLTPFQTRQTQGPSSLPTLYLVAHLHVLINPPLAGVCHVTASHQVAGSPVTSYLTTKHSSTIPNLYSPSSQHLIPLIVKRTHILFYIL